MNVAVGSSSNTSCLNDNLLYDFFFSIDPQTNPSQCSSMAISWNDNVTYPLHLYGLIPSGSAFEVSVPQTSSDVDIDWTVDIRSGTDFLLLMADSGTYQTGGSSSLLTVGSGDGSCINSTSPASATPSSSTSSSARSSSSSTSSSASTSPVTSSSSSTSTSTSSSAGVTGVGGGSAGGTSGNDSSGSGTGSSGSSKVGPIVGGVVGGVAFLALLALLAFCCVRRRKRNDSRKENDPLLSAYGASSGEKPGRRRPVDLLEEGGGGVGIGATRHDSGETHVEGQTGGYEVTPFRGGYPSPGLSHPEMAAVGGVAKADEARTPTGLESSTPLRPSVDSNREGTTASSGGGTFGTPSRTPQAQSTLAASDMATVGHGSAGEGGGVGGLAGLGLGTLGVVGGVERSNSIRKPASASTLREREPELARPLPAAPRFVQHEDSGRVREVGGGGDVGEVVDLPPRYDQLLARNPDQ
ncbi:hypothetical protein BCR39DRAFT_261379 [Naematelia encephala]|uniref:Epidermal growth factor receptor-like transmembrane-juxtamembrane segment domain-containing protein n=1 Tax=Naematelia encephala TaxID=71784 RepID=A0A1Y2AWG2_9TREE|nr:hypothetical protein BCR39DRAFT_261379 [Naematelia encephala]